jgi:hypothetical protein
MRTLAVTLTLVSCLAAGCVRPPDVDSTSAPATVPAVSLAAERSGETVRLTLTNRSDAAVGYNLCSSALLRREGGGWVVVPTDLVCTMEIRMLRPGASDSFRYPVPSGLTRGEYAWQARVEVPAGGAGRDVVSNPVSLP